MLTQGHRKGGALYTLPKVVLISQRKCGIEPKKLPIRFSRVMLLLGISAPRNTRKLGWTDTFKILVVLDISVRVRTCPLLVEVNTLRLGGARWVHALHVYCSGSIVSHPDFGTFCTHDLKRAVIVRWKVVGLDLFNDTRPSGHISPLFSPAFDRTFDHLQLIRATLIFKMQKDL